MIIDVLSRRATTTAEVISISSVYSSTTGQSTETEIIGSPIKCIFWEGATSKSLVSEAMRERVQATAIFKPMQAINGTRMRINSKKIYTIIGQEDIANQGKVRVVYLGEIA